MMLRFSFTFLCCFLLQPAFAQQPKVDQSEQFFKDGKIPQLKIEISEEELKKLRQKDREYVRCRITEDGKTKYEDVGIHLKGAAGSFRSFDDKPALTISFDRFKHSQTFHGLNKIHLNNSVQDPSFIQEQLCSELFLAAKVPTPRVSHARVWLNNRDVGFYVIKEGFNRAFLKRHFEDATGNLYDGGFLQDLDAPLKKQTGDGPDDHADLKAVVAACREGDTAKRWQKMADLINIEECINFMALELMCCHWDGYTQNRNNFRVYFDPKSKKMHIFPHGMDQMFGDPNFNIIHIHGTILCAAIMSNPDWRDQYRQKVKEYMPKFVPATGLIQRTEELRKRIRPTIESMNKQWAVDMDNHVRGLQERFKARAVSLVEQDKFIEPRPLKFDQEKKAIITQWEPRSESGDAILNQGKNPATLVIQCNKTNDCIASWRSTVLLSTGTYRFEAKAKATNIKSRQDHSGTGAGLRVSGATRTEKLEGSSDWKTLQYTFDVTEPRQEVVLVAELRCTAGEVQFELGSMKLIRMK